MSDERDPILDACLDEILGGQTPPDLAPRIMQAWSTLPPSLPTEPVVPPVQNPIKITAAAKSRTSSRSANPWVSRSVVSLVVAVSVVAIVMGIGFALRLELPSTTDTDVVQSPSFPSEDETDPQPRVVPHQNNIVDRPPGPRLPDHAPEVVTPEFATSPRFAADQDRPPFEFAINSPPSVAALDATQIVTVIDVAIRSAWRENDISPAPRDDDHAFAIRLFQRVLGREPTKAELQSFVVSRSKDKRARLVDELLTREENVVEFARHWSGLWADVLVGREGTVTENRISREGLQQYLRRAFQQAVPMDQIATELLTATGSGEIGSPKYNGATNFLLAHYDRDATQATSHVARAFLGQRMQCAQCHDHPSDSSLAQNRFWELNAFLRQLSVEPRETDDANPATPLVLANRDFQGDGGFDDPDAEVIYETATGQIKVAYPALPGVTKVPRSGILKEFDRRAGLALYVAGSQDFRRAVVNRVWSNIFGYGFTSPVDDLGPHNPPSHPMLLNDLADQFAAHDHDLRSLIRWMVLSETFQLGSGPQGDLADAPEFGRKRWFSHAYPAAVTKPVARESLLALAKAAASGKNDLGVGTTANVKPSFRTPGNPNSPPAITSPDVWQTGGFVPARIERILDGSMSVEQKLEHLFLVTVQRSPTNRERGLAKEIMGDMAKADRTTLLRIWWTLERSSEFGVDR